MLVVYNLLSDDSEKNYTMCVCVLTELQNRYSKILVTVYLDKSYIELFGTVFTVSFCKFEIM